MHSAKSYLSLSWEHPTFQEKGDLNEWVHVPQVPTQMQQETQLHKVLLQAQQREDVCHALQHSEAQMVMQLHPYRGDL